jgi:hypothetical protein
MIGYIRKNDLVEYVIAMAVVVGALLLVGGGTYFLTNLSKGGQTAVQSWNAACRDHDGVRRLENGTMAICLDGTVVER